MYFTVRTWHVVWLLYLSLSKFPTIKTAIVLSKVELKETASTRATAKIEPVNPPPMTAVFMRWYLLKNLTEVKLNGVFALRSKTGKLDGILYNRTVDACRFFKNPSMSRVLHIVQRELDQRSLMPSKCPVMEGPYYIQNISFTNMRIPSFLPPTSFRMEINLLEGNSKLVLGTVWYGRIMKLDLATRAPKG